MSQQQRRRVAISSGSIPVIPDYGNTFDMLTSEFNFMDDIRFKPLDVLLENYGTLINAYESYEWDSVYRQNKEMYSKMESEDLLAKVQRRHFPYRNEVIVVNPKYSYTTAFTKLPDYPVSLTSFNSGSPLIIKKFKVRLPITEAAVTLGRIYIEDFYPPIIDEVTGESSENPTVSQFYEDMKHRDEYLKSQFASMVSIQKAFLEELSADPYPGYVRYFTNEDYYKSLWSSRETGDFMYKVYDDNKNSIIPSDVLPGITDIHYLSYINRLSQIFGVNYSGEPSMIGNPGDIISYEFLENETKQYKNYAWDPQNNEWSVEFFDNFISPVLSRQMDNLISKMKAKNEFLIGLRPFMMAANYLPSFKINRDLIGSTTTTTTNAPGNVGVLTLPFSLDPGKIIDGSIETSTSYFKVDYWDGSSEIHPLTPDAKTTNAGEKQGSVFSKRKTNANYFSKNNTGDNVVSGTITISSCDVNGTPSGSILRVGLWNEYYGNVDLSGLTDLIGLKVINNQSITSINVNSLTSLTRLQIKNCSNLESIDITNLINLTNLQVQDMNLLTSIDVTGLINLQGLYVYNNTILTSIGDVSGLAELTSLNVSKNQSLTSLNVSGLLKLKKINIKDCQLLTSIGDLTNGGSLTRLQVRNIPLLTSIDWNNLTNLTSLQVQDMSSLTSIDLTSLSNLTQLEVYNNPLLTSLELNNSQKLKNLNVVNNVLLTSLDVSSKGYLTYLNVCKNPLLTSLGLNDLFRLGSLNVCKNPLLTSLDVSSLSHNVKLPNRLQYLYVNNNSSLTSLDVTSLTNLQSLYVNSNSLTSLDVTGLTNLTYLDANSNSLTSLDVTSLTNLQSLYVHANSLTSLDVTSLTNLQNLNVNNNSLTSLDVTGLTNLQNLYVQNNSLSSIDISNLLIELSVNGQPSGNFMTNIGRTSESDIAVTNLVDYSVMGKNWSLSMGDLIVNEEPTTTTTTTEEPTTTTTTTEEPTTTTTTTEEPTTTTTTTEEPTTTTTTTQSSGYYSYDFTSKVQRVLNGDNSLGDILAKRGVTDWDGTQRFVASDLNTGTQVYYIGTDGNKHFITFDTSISNDGVTNQQTSQPYNYLEIIDGVITGIFGDGVTFDSITPFN